MDQQHKWVKVTGSGGLWYHVVTVTHDNISILYKELEEYIPHTSKRKWRDLLPGTIDER